MNQSRRNRGAVARRGFTLAETLLALGLILLLMGALYSFSSQVALSRKRLETDSSRQRTLTDVLDAIERAGLTSLAGDSTLGAGVSGNATSLTIVSRSGSGLIRQRWKFDSAAGRVQVTTTPIHLGESTGEMPETPVPENWAEGLRSVRIRYLVGQQWVETFDSLASGVLPRAIEVQAWFTLPSESVATAANAATARPPTTDSESTQEIEPVQRAPDRRRMIVIDARMPEVAATPVGGLKP